MSVGPFVLVLVLVFPLRLLWLLRKEVTRDRLLLIHETEIRLLPRFPGFSALVPCIVPRVPRPTTHQHEAAAPCRCGTKTKCAPEFKDNNIHIACDSNVPE